MAIACVPACPAYRQASAGWAGLLLFTPLWVPGFLLTKNTKTGNQNGLRGGNSR